MYRWLYPLPLRRGSINTPVPTRIRSPADTQLFRHTIRYHIYQRRTFLNIPNVLLPPVVYLGLGIGLWTWKCCMMVLFQNKIIYMPGLPPNARNETIAEYKSECGGIEWREERIISTDGTKISLCLASVDSGPEVSLQTNQIYILYFQGNASSLPPRLPLISPILRVLRDHPFEGHRVQYTIVCCSYRGYWTSQGRPSERGIIRDATAALEWIKSDYMRQNNKWPVQVIIWGQSIGAGVATNLAALQDPSSKDLSLKALILETPFVSVRAMLETLYPQKWLPYRYLWPFLWNHLDSSKALRLMGDRIIATGASAPRVLILEAAKDELVPSSHGDVLEKRCIDSRLAVERKTVSNALHTEAMVRSDGRNAVVETIRNAARSIGST